MTLLTVTHEMDFARKVADRVLFIHAGPHPRGGTAGRAVMRSRTAELKQFLSALNDD
jgi:polar amino acid transport system ATP-binding protein